MTRPPYDPMPPPRDEQRSPYGGWPPPGGRPMPDDPLVARHFSDWTGKIVDVVARSWRPLIVVQLILAVPVAVLTALFDQSVGADASSLQLSDITNQNAVTIDHPGTAAAAGVALVVVWLGFGAVTSLASMWVAVRNAAARPAPLPSAFRFGAARAARLIGWEIVVAILVAVGLLALIVPGIYLAVVLLPTVLGVVAFERGGISRCFALARGQFLPLLGRCCVALLVATAYSEVVLAILKVVYGDGGSVWARQLTSSVLELPLDITLMAFLLVTYAELRGRHEPLTTQRLGVELGR